jgi:carbon storage regulator
MLVLSIKQGERVLLNRDIVLRVVEVRGRAVRLGFEAPADVEVLREKVAVARGALPVGGPIEGSGPA